MEENWELFIDFLSERLRKPLPGLESQKMMAPTTPKDYFRTFEPSETANQSAVMALFVKNKSGIDLLLTLRSKNISHSGQISFPGGRCEQGETIEEAALRETYEETGIDSGSIKIIGKLSDLFVPPSDNIITPVLGYIEDKPLIKVNHDEVEEVFYVPLSNLINDDFRKNEEWDFKGVTVTIPLWNIHPTTPLWGATAMIISELLEICREFYNN
ncbi:MAG: CoA pyrophosphatase [bacterium]